MALLNGIIAGISGLALVPMLEGLAAPPKDRATMVRVQLGTPGLRDQGEQGQGGNIPGVSLWDLEGRSIGLKTGQNAKIAQGSFADIEVDAPSNIGGIAAEYLSVTAGGNDAICIAAVTVTFPGGGHSPWTGDIAATCNYTNGAFVYPSSVDVTTAGQEGDDSEPHKPYCVWIDRDGSNGIPHQGFGMHLPDFGTDLTRDLALSFNANKDLMCRSGPRFRMYEQLRTEDPILIFQPPLEMNSTDGTDVDPSKVIDNPGVMADVNADAWRELCEVQANLANLPECRNPPKSVQSVIPLRAPEVHRLRQRHYRISMATNSTGATWNSEPTANNTWNATDTQPKKHRFEGHLVVSKHKRHSAREVCEHPNTWGPSFASTMDGFLCDMVDKKLYRLCDPKLRPSCCFDIDTKEWRSCSGKTVPQGSYLEVDVANITKAAIPPASRAPYSTFEFW